VICFEHGVEYDGVDTLMCPTCEEEICEQHDPTRRKGLKSIITVGISTSGKSSLAAKKVLEGWTEVNRDWIRFNLVKPGSDWRSYKFTKAQEAEVTEIEGKMIMEAYSRGENIIVSNTNLHAPTRTKLIKHLEDLGYEVEVHQLEISLEEAWKRDAYRLNGVGHNVLYSQWQKWNEVIQRPTYTPNPEKPWAVIVDIDGTVADMDGKRGPFEWDKVDGDEPRHFVISMVQGYAEQGYHVLFVSGRSDECQEKTMKWLEKHVGDCYIDGLWMRKAGDMRKDNAVKEEIFWTHLADSYNIVACIDDRPQMIRLWHDLKIPNVIAVANPYVEF